METNNPVNSRGKEQYPENMSGLALNSGPRPTVQFWGPPPLFPFQQQGPHGWAPCYPDYGQLRYGASFNRPPGMFTLPPPPRPASNLHCSGAGAAHSTHETWLRAWIESRSLKEKDEKSAVYKKITISEAKQRLRMSVHELKKLRERHDSLLSNMSSICEEDWKKKWSDIECGMSKVTGALSSFSKAESLSILKANLLKRAKKRGRSRRQLAHNKIETYRRQVDRQRLHQQVDAWLADMQLSVERARRDEALKQEADSVLSEVTHRQSDGRRQIALLEALQKLRRARIQAVEAQGGTLSSEQKKQAEQSNTIMDRLLGLWSRQMDEYSKEEHGLRVMLEESAAKQSDIEIQNLRHTLSQWEACLFGTENLESGEPESLESLVAIRHAWDQYLVPDDDFIPMASTIPVGWVLPTTPNSTQWQKFLLQC